MEINIKRGESEMRLKEGMGKGAGGITKRKSKKKNILRNKE